MLLWCLRTETSDDEERGCDEEGVGEKSSLLVGGSCGSLMYSSIDEGTALPLDRTSLPPTLVYSNLSYKVRPLRWKRL